MIKPKPVSISMHAEIQRTQRQFLELYQQQRDYLRAKPAGFLQDLQHEAEELAHHETFSVRAAAEINRAAAGLELETANSIRHG